MNTNNILSASILDLVFDDRNKEYGAYELRKTYPRRITKALLITGAIAVLVFAGAALANSLKPKQAGGLAIRQVILETIPDQKDPIPPPEQKNPEPVQMKTQAFTTLRIVNEKDVDPPPTQTDLVDSKISDVTQDGTKDVGIVETNVIDKGKDIIEPPKTKESDDPIFVELQAKFIGNWEKFLIRNLNANVPAENGAPAGSYRVVIQFVVDKEGNVSDIKPLTSLGYGMEQEAVRVLKKATKWEPGIQNGYAVKSYRSQPITFVVEEP
jgi:protein TonB